MSELQELQTKLAQFSLDRDWDKFHSPKNLTMALAGEAGELLELFQWLTEKESRNLSEEQKDEVAQELADILLYLVRIADKTGIDLFKACEQKMRLNEEKYPISKAYGVSTKYSKL